MGGRTTKAHRRTWYQKNKAKQYALVQARKQRTVAKLQAYKRTLKCSKCGFSHPAALHFHHRDPAQKERTVSKMPWGGCGWDRIMLEIEKCDVLCANCHAVLHADETLEVGHDGPPKASVGSSILSEGT